MACAYNAVNGFGRSNISMFLIFYQKPKCAIVNFKKKQNLESNELKNNILNLLPMKS